MLILILSSVLVVHCNGFALTLFLEFNNITTGPSFDVKVQTIPITIQNISAKVLGVNLTNN